VKLVGIKTGRAAPKMLREKPRTGGGGKKKRLEYTRGKISLRGQKLIYVITSWKHIAAKELASNNSTTPEERKAGKDERGGWGMPFGGIFRCQNKESKGGVLKIQS